MKGVDRRTVSVVSSVAVCALTLSVFLAGRNNGPISAVTRFNQAVVKRDPRLAASVVYQNFRSASVQFLWGQLARSITAETPTYYALTEKSKAWAIVSVTYVLSKDSRVYLPYVVKKVDGVWVVDCTETVSRAVVGKRR